MRPRFHLSRECHGVCTATIVCNCLSPNNIPEALPDLILVETPAPARRSWAQGAALIGTPAFGSTEKLCPREASSVASTWQPMTRNC